MSYEIELIHPGGETKTLPIESYFQTFVSVRWGLNGLYDIRLKENVMIARSVRARMRNRCYWKVKDIEALRKHVAEYFAKHDKTQFNFQFNEHTQLMPGNIIEGKTVNLECACGHKTFLVIDKYRVSCVACKTKYVGFRYRNAK